MKDWWIKTGCLMTGWNYQILRTCTEASRKQLKKYASAILILIILWAFIGYSFAERYVNAPWWASIIVSIFFVIIIVQIERQIILTIGKNRWLAVFRTIIAFIMAILGSTILDQTIFKDDIEKKMVQIVDRQVNEQLPNRLTIIDKKLQELQTEIDSLDKKNMELYDEISKRPTINTVSTSVTHTKVKQPDGSIITLPQRTVSNTPISNPKAKEAEINNNHLEELRKQKEEYSLKKIQTEGSLRTELKSKQGFLEELNAILEILIEKPIALVFYSILFIFLMSLELFVVLSKVGDEKSDYDLVVGHQLEQKKKTLDNLSMKREVPKTVST
jgi:DNA integrity scanning protein DisA with diadenylate cyclase activity